MGIILCYLGDISQTLGLINILKVPYYGTCRGNFKPTQAKHKATISYTLPGDQENSRATDWVDTLLLIRGGLDLTRTTAMIGAVFYHRSTHSPPPYLTPPPASWSRQFVRLVAEVGEDIDISDAYSVVAGVYARVMGQVR